MDMKFKLLHVTHREYPAFRVDLTELFSNEIVNRRGHYIDWMIQSVEAHDPAIIDLNSNERAILPRTVADKGIVSKCINKAFFYWHDISILRQSFKTKYDAIQVRDKAFAAFIGLLSARLRKIQFYYWMSYPHVEHDYLTFQTKSASGKKLHAAFYWLRSKITGFFLYRIILPNADFVFVQSERMLAEVAKKGIDKTKMMSVSMGVTLSEKPVYPSQDPRLLGKKPVIYLGTMLELRRIDNLIEAFALVLDREPSAVMLLVGDAPAKDMEIVKSTIRRLNLEDHVILTGFIPMEQAWQYVKASKVGLSILPPIHIMEVSSVTKVVEYMSLDIPSVVNDVGDQGMIINDSQAGIVVPYDIQAIANALLEILQNESQAIEMGKNGREYILANRSYEVLSTRLENKYLELLQ